MSATLHPDVAAWIRQGDAGGYWAALGWLICLWFALQLVTALAKTAYFLLAAFLLRKRLAKTLAKNRDLALQEAELRAQRDVLERRANQITQEGRGHAAEPAPMAETFNSETPKPTHP